MGRINNRLLFFTTSPRTPIKMIPEIHLLHEEFSGKKWNILTQELFMDKLAQSNNFEGAGSLSDKAFSARDRINRAPKSLGFINLKPHIELTKAGEAFVYGKHSQEAFLRQLLKFQLPSPYHKESPQIDGTFYIRPYLEVIRLVRELEYITLDEFKIFAVQMTDYHKFNMVRNAIAKFRQELHRNQGSYKHFIADVWEQAILEVHGHRIAQGNIKTRESEDTSLKKFITTQKRNMRDYADACFRYLRYTGLISISHSNRSMSIFPEKVVEVDFILNNVQRDPIFIDNLEMYKEYLFAIDSPVLYSDDKKNTIDMLMRIGSFTKRELIDKSLEELKDLRDHTIQTQRNTVIHKQVSEIKSYALYSEIIDTYNEIISDEYYDAPLMFEYNTWRAMTMLNGGNIKGNFKFDDAGHPLTPAASNLPDIECDYDDFTLCVEVSLQGGQRQYDLEAASVVHHYEQFSTRTNKDTYCLFISPTISPMTLAHFYALNRTEVGHKAKIIPLELDMFMRLVENSYNYKPHPVPLDFRHFLDHMIEQCHQSDDEHMWYLNIQTCVDHWLVAEITT